MICFVKASASQLVDVCGFNSLVELYQRQSKMALIALSLGAEQLE